ncbi:ferredoxin [Jongsikchunia kroppenstedtii]|uniref:NADH-quinone oxidoreductase subunit B family protein n=1 Tax=Jongsikchunia kroppenstedtii TaxID=1121721 RepID=UPI000360F6AD|nr:ferredoxin [Jongsikchunia kroppenstedtii]
MIEWWPLRGVRNGILTSRWPRAADPYFDEFRGSVAVLSDDPVAAVAASRTCPTQAITIDESNERPIDLDRGRCILCRRCIDAAPTVFGWRPGADVARLSRSELHSAPTDDDDLPALQERLARRVKWLRHSVHIRHVDAGSDGSDEWEIAALANPVYDLHRLGIFFTASPRHADILLITGVGAIGMTGPLLRTIEAVPEPRVVIACGTDAISGGLIGDGYAASRGIDTIVPVDVWVPGAPPTPFSLLHAILLALHRLPRSSTEVSS